VPAEDARGEVVRVALFAIVTIFYVLVRRRDIICCLLSTATGADAPAASPPAKEFDVMSRILAAALMAAIAASPAYADEITVGQKDKTFSMSSATLKPGDTLKFINDDTTEHNVLITGPKDELRNSCVQEPGEAAAFQLDKAGSYQVESGIHPKMKISVVVK